MALRQSRTMAERPETPSCVMCWLLHGTIEGIKLTDLGKGLQSDNIGFRSGVRVGVVEVTRL